MRQLQKVLWTKGVLLTPQHLQLQDRYVEDLLSFQMSALLENPWGFSAMEVDRELLDGGMLGLTSAQGLFPDGLGFEMPDTDPLPEPRLLQEGWRPDQETLEVYLAITEYKPGGRNVSVDQEGGDSRFSAEVVFQRDENTGQAEKPVQVARKNFRILLEGEILEGHSVLPLARVVRTESGGYDLDPSFVPPLVDISASSMLMTIARRLVELLSARSADLAGTRRQRGPSLADFTIQDSMNFWLLYTVNTFLPPLRHIYEVSRGHPARLYQTMLSLAGALTTFSSEGEAGALPPYEHTNLSNCFSALDERVRILLETVIPQNYRSIPLRPVKAFVYAAALESALLSARQIYLAVGAETERSQLAEKVLELVKVGAADNLDHLYRRGLPGLELTHVQSPPSAVPIKMDYEYFLIDTSGEEWQEVLSARNLAVYVPAAIRDPALELVAILPDGKS
ncbi:MAG: type VI secretion system baseplate subunit TssK [Gemmatimonadota bacterium]